MAQVVPSEEEALAWSSLTPAPQIPPRAATRPTGSTTAIADALAGLARVNPCDPQVVNHFRRVPPVVGLDILIQAEREWVAARRSDGNFWSAWKARLQQHLLVSGTFCQNPTLELEDIEWIIEQYGSQRLLRVLEEDSAQFQIAFRFLIAELTNLQRVRSRRLSPDLRLCLHSRRYYCDGSNGRAAKAGSTQKGGEGERTDKESRATHTG